MFAQRDFSDTLWFDNDWNESDKTNATYFRVYKKSSDRFIVYDKYLNGKTQMYAEATRVKPDLVSDGQVIYYSANGSKTQKGMFQNNKMIGTWVQYFQEEKDSSVYEVMLDGSKVYSRRSPLDKEEVFTIVEKQAEFPGGITALSDFLKKNIAYPKKLQESFIGGRTILKFVVDETGDIANLEVIASSGMYELDAEALRVIETMPKWKPAEMTGKPVKCYFNLPINFGMEVPYFIFNRLNTNQYYMEAKELVKKKELDEALNSYNKDVGDIDAWYNMGVIYFLSNDKLEAKRQFEKVKSNSSVNSQYFKLSERYLAKHF